MRISAVSLRTLAVLGAGFSLTPNAVSAQDDTDAVSNQDQPPVIIVTAQGREQELADVPVAISAVTAETLANSGTTDIRELN